MAHLLKNLEAHSAEISGPRVRPSRLILRGPGSVWRQAFRSGVRLLQRDEGQDEAEDADASKRIQQPLQLGPNCC